MGDGVTLGIIFSKYFQAAPVDHAKCEVYFCYHLELIELVKYAYFKQKQLFFSEKQSASTSIGLACGYRQT